MKRDEKEKDKEESHFTGIILHGCCMEKNLVNKNKLVRLVSVCVRMCDCEYECIFEKNIYVAGPFLGSFGHVFEANLGQPDDQSLVNEMPAKKMNNQTNSSKRRVDTQTNNN